MLHTLSTALFTLALCSGSSNAAKTIVQIHDPPPGIISFDFAVHLNLSLGGSKIADLDRARAATKLADIAGLSRRDGGSVTTANTGITYVADVEVGEPATTYSLLVDTGSSNTWIGANKTYQPTKSSVNLGKNVTISYGSGMMRGSEYNDTITLSADLVIQQQSIGVANTTSGFDGCDGILGLGPVQTTANTVQNMSTVPTVMNNLYSQGKIASEVLAISFAPTTTEPNGNGELTFGGVDSSKYTGEITYTQLTKTSPASKYWGVDMSIAYGTSGKKILNSGSGIVDTGTTLILLATNAYDAYVNATGAKLDDATGLLKIENDDYDKLESLYFSIGGTNFELTTNAQTFPRPLNEFIGGDTNSTYLVIGDLGVSTGSGLDFINGYTFLERFYSVYDTTNQRVGFATTPNTNATSN